MLGDLTGRTALVTGAGSGIGRGIVHVLSAQGARVALGDLDMARADAVAGEVPTAIALDLDVTNPNGVATAIDAVLERWGALDILINNAGVPADPQRETQGDREADWDRTFAVNVKGTVHCCEAAIPYLPDSRGRIINIASMAGHAARRTGGAYAASKAALLRYTKGLAVSMGPRRITVNAICPGAVWTRFQEDDIAHQQRSDSMVSNIDPYELFLQRYVDVIPLGRPQTPEDIGAMAAFLASDDGANITGQCIHVDGGAVLRD